MNKFIFKPDMKPAGDQSQAIEKLIDSIKHNNHYSTLLGVTGSGKTFTMAKVIEALNRPTLIISHNKTLAAQLYREFKEFFPDNAVEYFVSYYDYYQPEAYIPSKDLYIEKDTSINDEIERLRLKATSSILSRNDVILVASVSCIYGLGSPEEYKNQILFIDKKDKIERDDLLKELINIQYIRNDFDPQRGTFRVKGDIIDIFPSYLNESYRMEFFGDEIETIQKLNPVSGEVIESVDKLVIYPAKIFVISKSTLDTAIHSIKQELKDWHLKLKIEKKELEAKRILTKTNFDIEMMLETGYCKGIENYSRHLSSRSPGQRPYVLLDYFRDDFITFIDESHATIPQLKGMYNGDRARKQNLVNHGFRLPSALDNRPLYFEELNEILKTTIFVSATPGDFETENSNKIAEQIIRPTGLVDPQIIVRPSKGQIQNLIKEIEISNRNGERSLVTTLTKRMSEDLCDHLAEKGFKVRYLHSEIETIERVEILRDLRIGKIDVIVGINLLREGLDLPEVSLVAILDADKEGFLRSERSLIQTAGRASRNINGRVIFYADNFTNSMQKTINESERRRKIQMEYNEKHNITPSTIKKEIMDIIEREKDDLDDMQKMIKENTVKARKKKHLSDAELKQAEKKSLEKLMLDFARDLKFEQAAYIRDHIMNNY